MPALPALPAPLVARPLRAGDIPGVAAVLAAAEPVDDTGEHEDEADLGDEWLNDLVDLGRDGLAVLDGDELVGYAMVTAPPTFRDALGVHLDGRVRPDHRGRGLGRALLDWQLARGAELHAERHPGAPARLTVSVLAGMASLERLVQSVGLEPTRHYFQMERELADVPPAPAVDGVDLVPFAWDRDDEVRGAHNAAFVEHHGSSERDVESWRVMYTGRTAFRPDLSTLALADGAVVGYALAYVYESDTRATGHRAVYFGQIGVLPPARGRGVATAAVTASLQAAAARDCRTAQLGVDSANSTGALNLYERLGFAVRRTRTSWTRSLPPVPAR